MPNPAEDISADSPAESPTAGVPTAGVTTAGLPTAGVPTAGVTIGSAQVPYLDQYVGLWLMNATHFWAKYEFIRQMNISLHVAQAQANRDAAAGAGGPKKPAGGYGYVVGEDGVAIIELRGSLMKQESSADASTSTVAIRRDVRAAMNDTNVKAVMFVHDSPGGTVAGSFELADDIAALAKVKPTGSFVDGLAASADYLQAAMTGFISAFRTAEIGSIGVRMVVVDSSAKATLQGLKVYAIDSGGMKSAGQPGTEITADQLAYFQGLVDTSYQNFIEAVARGRRMSTDRAKQLGDGRVHAAAQAKQLGLIDHVETFDEAMARLRAVAVTGIPKGRMMPAAKSQSSELEKGGVSVTTRSGNNEIAWQAETVEDLVKLRDAWAPKQANETTAKESSGADSGDNASSGSAGDSAAATHEEDHSMSDSTKTAAAGTTTAGADQNTGPKPATIAELKAAFPNDPAFALESAEKAYTLVEAKAAYADVLAERNQKLAKENSELKSKAAADSTTTATGRRPGVAPIESSPKRNAAAAGGAGGGAGAGVDSGDAVEAFNAAVDEQMQKPGFENRKKAVDAVRKKDPELNQAYLLATNAPTRKVRDLIADKFDAAGA